MPMEKRIIQGYFYRVQQSRSERTLVGFEKVHFRATPYHLSSNYTILSTYTIITKGVVVYLRTKNNSTLISSTYKIEARGFIF